MDHQPLPLRDQLNALMNLQEVDLKIDSLKKKKHSLPGSLKNLDESFQKINITFDLKKSALGEIDKTMRQTQAALELNRDRLKRAHTKLEAVHNSQEFQAANKEIDQLKKLNSSLEEQLKKSHQEVEIFQAELKQLEAELAKTLEERNAQTTLVSEESSKMDVEINLMITERQKYTPKIEKRILGQYDRVRLARGGLGLVPAVHGRCRGCNMIVPPQLFNEILKYKSVQSCPSCHRILFTPEAPTEITGGAGQNPATPTAPASNGSNPSDRDTTGEGSSSSE